MNKRIPKEIREEILNKVKTGETVREVSERYGISTKTVYAWLRAEVMPDGVSQLKYNRLKKENEELKRIIGMLTLDLSRKKK